ncbi:MAG: hypothetical protein JO227_06500 [Acetobacteraceae bacterium]|nr:hypothetical protein [Acetobacteraceae bacterium]
MRRQTFLGISAAPLALPSVAKPESKRVLKFIPRSDLGGGDPVWTTHYRTLAHAYMVFDTLYGQNGYKDRFRATPQMLAGHTVEDEGRTCKLKLRDSLMFHDGEKVLARECVASIKRWGTRELFGQTLMARIDEISAPASRKRSARKSSFEHSRKFPTGHLGSRVPRRPTGRTSLACWKDSQYSGMSAESDAGQTWRFGCGHYASKT